MLSYSIQEESLVKAFTFVKIGKKKEFFNVKQDQKICSQRLSEAAQKISSFFLRSFLRSFQKR